MFLCKVLANEVDLDFREYKIIILAEDEVRYDNFREILIKKYGCLKSQFIKIEPSEILDIFEWTFQKNILVAVDKRLDDINVKSIQINMGYKVVRISCPEH
jgi:hypothetical protein